MPSKESEAQSDLDESTGTTHKPIERVLLGFGLAPPPVMRSGRDSTRNDDLCEEESAEAAADAISREADADRQAQRAANQSRKAINTKDNVVAPETSDANDTSNAATRSLRRAKHNQTYTSSNLLILVSFPHPIIHDEPAENVRSD